MFIVNVTAYNESSFIDYDTDDTPVENKIFNAKTAPLFLMVLLPMISLKSPTFFTKFNSIGTLNVFFLIGVVFFLGASWGVNANFIDVDSDFYIPLYKNSFPSLSGMMALGLFIHNAVITIMKNNRHQENNVSLSFSFNLVFRSGATITPQMSGPKMSKKLQKLAIWAPIESLVNLE